MIWVEFIGVAAPEVKVELVMIVLLQAVEQAVVLLAEEVDSLLSFIIPKFYLLLLIFLTPTLLSMFEEEDE